MQTVIEGKLASALDLQHCEVVNESRNHNVPEGAESHFKVVLVAEDFVNTRLIQRHKLVHQILASELEVIHALAVHTYTADEWRSRHGDAPMSPPCLN